MITLFFFCLGYQFIADSIIILFIFTNEETNFIFSQMNENINFFFVKPKLSYFTNTIIGKLKAFFPCCKVYTFKRIDTSLWWTFRLNRTILTRCSFKMWNAIEKNGFDVISWKNHVFPTTMGPCLDPYFSMNPTRYFYFYNTFLKFVLFCCRAHLPPLHCRIKTIGPLISHLVITMMMMTRLILIFPWWLKHNLL